MLNPVLRNILRPALPRCQYLDATCKGLACFWDPSVGMVPRGFAGGHGELHEICLVIVTSEPGPRADGETYAGSADDMLRSAIENFERFLLHDGLKRDGRPAPYHQRLSKVLAKCWPGRSHEEVLRTTFLTNSVLCSAPSSRAPHEEHVELKCGANYLKPTLDALPHKFILALGGKALRRLRNVGIEPDHHAPHPSAWGSNAAKEKDWAETGERFQSWRKSHPAPAVQ